MSCQDDFSPNVYLLGKGWGLESIGLQVFQFHHVISAYCIEDIIPALKEMESRCDEGFTAIGFVAYEAAAAFGLPCFVPDNSDIPLVWFGMLSNSAIEMINTNPSPPNCLSRTPSPTIEIPFEHYKENINKIKNQIAKGYTYQVNYTCKASFQWNKPSFELFLSLFQTQPVPYAMYLNAETFSVLSLSPELFVERRGRSIKSKPMKGTIKRGRYLQEDEMLARQLLNSEKDRAENIMIVDMVRNDLGRICEFGSVSTNNLLKIEKYHTIFQMTSEINGTLKKNINLIDILGAVFPAASITGAPKVQTMNIIKKLEYKPRGIYCGCAGIIHPNRDCVFNVAIRTLSGVNGSYQLGIGGGIVWDSKIENEYKEIKLKSKFISEKHENFSLIETFRLNNKGILLFIDEHLKRLEQSAYYWDFQFNEKALMESMDRYIENLDEYDLAIRIELHPDGRLSITHRELTQVPSVVKIKMASKRIDSTNRFFYHKTTNRSLYNDELKELRSLGYFDSIFLNEKGHFTEGCITNLFYKMGSCWFTPPINDGLLPGVWRHYYKENVQAVERSLTMDDLEWIETLKVGNSVIFDVTVDEFHTHDQIYQFKK